MSRLGPYEVHERVATGGMAELFLATEDLPNGTRHPVAIKRIRPEAADDPKLVNMLIDEGRVTRQLTHPGIARTLRTVKAHDVFYLVMEFVDGRDLRSIIKKLAELGKRLPPALAAYIGMKVADALDYAHRAATNDGQHLGIVHRDVNPTNLMVSYSGEVRVIDFGIARAADRLTATQAGVVKGKLRYLAPEQAAGKEIDHRADLYALGLVLWELFVGERPMQDLPDMEFVRIFVRGPLPSLANIDARIPAPLAAVVDKALQRDRNQRYAWGSDLADDLRLWLAELKRQPTNAELASMMSQLFPGEDGRLKSLLGG